MPTILSLRTFIASRRAVLLAGLLAGLLATTVAPEGSASPPTMPPVARGADAARLQRFHEMLADEPHVAGTPGDHRLIERLEASFASMGLEVEAWWFRPLLARPIAARLEIVGVEIPAPGEADASSPRRRGVVPLPIRERNLAEDPATAHPDLTFGWNAFSGSGVAEGEVVYANLGLDGDYEQLRAWGIDVAGRIVVARYGGAYRGHKVRCAEAAGAAGLVLFIDPADSGDAKGPTWPEGGWANETCIQRGSVLTLRQPGDALTPFVPALPDAERLAIEDVGLFSIPVQPIGYAAAREILSRMQGPEASSLPGGASWQGGLPFPYRVTGGPDLRLRLEVVQERSLGDTANVLGRLTGRERPAQEVIVGSHHDAWGFGAADPAAGTMVTMEVARLFAVRAAAGERPRRSVTFATWGAEEFGIIGSTEWVEAERDRLRRDGVAYLNLDMSAMGPNFGLSGSPTLWAAARRAAAMTPAAGDPEGRSVLELLDSRGGFSPGISGGGSDHVAFLGHVGVPVASIGAGGSPGVSYHSNYDTLAWYRSIVGEDYAPALMLARFVAALAWLLADEPVLPLRVRDLAAWSESSLGALAAREDAVAIREDLTALASRAGSLAVRGAAIDARLDAIAAAPLGEPARLLAIDEALRAADRAWLDDRGLFERPWYRNLAAVPDRRTGYGTTTLPIVAEPLADGRSELAAEGVVRLGEVMDRLEAVFARLEDLLREEPSTGS